MMYQRLLPACVAGCVVLLWSADVFAAAAVQRRQQMQQQMQQQAYQQAIAQRQAQEVAAYRQAMAQRQAVVQQQAAYQKAAMEYAAYKQTMQQAVARRGAEINAANQIKGQIAQHQAQQVQAYQVAAAKKQVAQVVAYQQARATQQVVAGKVQAEVNDQVREYAAYLAARKAALARQGIAMQQAATGQKLLQNAALQRAQARQARAAATQKVAAETAARAAAGRQAAALMAGQDPAEGPPSGDDTVVGLRQLWDALDVSAEAWDQIIDREIKVLTVAEYIDRFGKLDIKIRKAPGHYAGLIDALAAEMEGFLAAPFMNILSYAAIVEYDFDNGTDKDALARQVLGKQEYESNRRRVLGK